LSDVVHDVADHGVHDVEVEDLVSLLEGEVVGEGAEDCVGSGGGVFDDDEVCRVDVDVFG
jgi:hypothetical protein